MEPYKVYKEKLEKRFDKTIKDILVEYYIVKELGPSVGAKELDIPREAFLYYRNLYDLKEIKHAYFQKGLQLPKK